MLTSTLNISRLPQSPYVGCSQGSPRPLPTERRRTPSPSPSHPRRARVAPCPLADAFSPTYNRTPGFYFSPSNPFCRRRVLPSSTSPARRLDYISPQGSSVSDELRSLCDGIGWLIEAAVTRCEHDAVVRVFFWAALVVFLSSICGFGTPPIRQSDLARFERDLASTHTWRAGEYHDYLEGIWETGRHLM